MSIENFYLFLTVTIAGIITALAIGLKGVIAEIMETWRSRIAKRRYSLGFKAISDFHDILEKLKPMPNVDRVLVFSGKNCGGMPEAGKPYTVNCFYGWPQDATSRYSFSIQIDKTYCDMLEKVVQKGKSIQNTSTMPEDSILREYYETEGVFQTVLFYLNINRSNNELVFASVGSYHRDYTNNEMAQLDLVFMQLRELMGELG